YSGAGESAGPLYERMGDALPAVHEQQRATRSPTSYPADDHGARRAGRYVGATLSGYAQPRNNCGRDEPATISRLRPGAAGAKSGTKRAPKGQRVNVALHPLRRKKRGGGSHTWGPKKENAMNAKTKRLEKIEAATLPEWLEAWRRYGR